MSTRDEDLTIEERQAEAMREVTAMAMDASAFPFTLGEFREDGGRRDVIGSSGMTLRQYAAIHLRVPDSGEEWLDRMIERARRDEFAGRAMVGMATFTAFPKIARIFRGCVITEKIDGTNASVLVTEDGGVFAGSRTRWITPEDDNFGFARWVHEHAAELRQLGPGHHFGEWWGQGIQRRYGMNEKRFSLFNVSRWEGNDGLPRCCHVVPVLYRGDFDTSAVDAALGLLWENGSLAAPGFANPEGVVVWHEHARVLFKATLDKNDAHKWSAGGAS